MKKLIITTLLAVATMLMGCSSRESGDKLQEQPIASQQEADDEGTDKSAPDASLSDEDQAAQELLSQYTPPENIVLPGEETEYDGVTYKLENIEFTKSPGDRSIEEFHFFESDEREDNGTLTGSSSYAFVDITVTNNGTEEKTLSMNSKTFVLLGEDYHVEWETGAEARYINDVRSSDPKRSFYYTLQPGDSIRCEVGYILEDEYLTEQLVYCVGQGGSDLDSPDNRFYLLKDLLK